MTAPFPEIKITSYVLGVSDTNADGGWMKFLTPSRSETTCHIPQGSSTCTFSNTSPGTVTVQMRMVYDVREVMFLPPVTLEAGRSAVFKINNANICNMSVIQKGTVYLNGRFGLEIITMPPGQ